MNDLEKYFKKNKGRYVEKWDHYLEIYDRHFSRFRNKEINVLEIGVYYGGSLQMWKEYFGPKANIYGIDINPECKNYEEENVRVMIGSQADPEFLLKITETIPKVDILIDDGGHLMNEQIITFEELFDHIQPDGVYLCEDLHTSYWSEFGGGHKNPETFIEYSKDLIDQLNAFHSVEKTLKKNDFTSSVNSIHYYDSVLVIEKNKRDRPKKIFSGVDSEQSDRKERKVTKREFRHNKPAQGKVPVTVVIPVFNGEKYLGEAIRSVQDQTLKVDEILVVDNNSTDNSRAIALELGAKVLDQPKQGTPAARNLGIAKVRMNGSPYSIRTTFGRNKRSSINGRR
ncbi:MAG: glycosyltransferase [Pyrinomonadaceae bacterium]